MRIPDFFFHTARALNFVGADALLGKKHRGIGSIFALHSVVHNRRDYLYDGHRTSAAFLEAAISYYASHKIDIVSLDEALRRIRILSPAPFVCFTFDDGYKDNLTVALPIFERYSSPFTVFITTCMIDHSIDNWWTGIIEIVKQNDCIEVDGLSRRLPASDFREKLATYDYLCRAKADGKLDQDQLSQLFRRYDICPEALIDKDALTEKEVRHLSRHPLVEIGAHTKNHPHLKHLCSHQARREISDNKAWLADITSREISHFAYPFGDRDSCGIREFTLVQELGFQTGLTTRIGNLVPEHVSHTTALPRLRMFNQHESMRLLEFQRYGAATTLTQGFGARPVTS